MRTLLFTAALAALVGHGFPAIAAPVISMDVAPTTLELKPGAVDLFYVSNHGAEPVMVQIECFDWAQAGDQDKLAPSQGLIASPPMATIAPGARQLVRLLAAPAPGSAESTFRIIVSQLADNAPRQDTGIRMLLRFGVPVFSGDGPDKPTLAWEAARRGDTLDLAVRNDGAHTVKLAQVRLTAGATSVAAEHESAFDYVLPGATRHFAFHGVAVGTALHVSGRDLRSENDLAADVVAHP